MMLSQTVRQAAARFGERTSYVSPTGWELSYAELDRLSDETAAGLTGRGVGAGDVVAAVLAPCPEYIVVQVAAARVGAIMAGINHRLALPEQAALVELADPRLVVTTEDAGSTFASRAVAVIEPAADSTAALVGLRSPGAQPDETTEDPNRPLSIVFTSGTTGTPRGAVYAGRQIEFITQVDTGGKWADPTSPALHGMSAMSLTHLGPTTKLTGNLMRGGTTHLLDRWSPTIALDLVSAYQMPSIAGVPTQISLMLHHPDVDDYDLSSVRAVVMGGGPATPTLIRELRERLGVPVMVRYSCTEAGVGVGTSLTDDPEDAELTVGRPHPGVELTIRNPSGVAVAIGDVGEICLRSPATMSRYWRDPEATEATLWPDGAVRTGDLGFLDNRDRLHLSGRSGDMYVRGGYNVHPLEVEAALIDCPGVRALAVVSRPDEVMGELGVAVVVAADPTSPPLLETLRTHAEHSIARHKLPEDLILLDRLPLTAMEKLDRQALIAMVRAAP